MRAIVVDDSRALRRILRGILEPIGCEVAEAADGREALARLTESGPPDLMLIDWNMPEMNGLELVQAVRADAAYRDVRLIMVTTQNEIERMQSALSAGADEYVMKPFDTETILDKLRLLNVV